MNKLAFVLLLAAAACSKKDDSKLQAPPAGSGSGSGSALVIKPYTPAAGLPAPIVAAVTAGDRTPEDRALDAGRKPAEVLAFFKLAPDQRVLEVFAGGGYTSELLNRIVGAKGKLYAQNTKEVLEKFAQKGWDARMTHAAMAGAVAVVRPIDDPAPSDAKDLDAVITVLNYHDTVNMKADRTKMNKAIFDALKPGGVYGIVDSSAKAGTGIADTDTFHRIDEDLVKKEVLAAGFVLDGESDVMRNPADTRDWSSSPRAAGEKRGTSDQFVLRFVKPAAAAGATPGSGSGSGSDAGSGSGSAK